MQAMLLAAGLGTRLRPYTLYRPKPLFPVLNRPLLLILLDMLAEAGCDRIVVNGHHLGGQLEKELPKIEGLFYQFEPEVLGTGGGLRRALSKFSDEPVLVMNGDIFHNIDLAALYRHHVNSGNRITLALHDYPRFNMVDVRNETITTFRSKSRDEGKNTLAFTGIHVVDPSVIEMIPPDCFFHIIDLYEKLIRQGEQIGYFRVDDFLWRDIGTLEDYLELHARLLSGEMKLPSVLPAPQGPWLIDGKVVMDDGVQLSGWGCIGRAKIGRNVKLCNCVVWDDVVIADGTRLENKLVTPAPH